jgi:carbon-monoxide dehydrogenase medium subunit
MSAARFDYYAPAGLQEALNLLADLGRDASVLAGGTDLMIKIRHGLVKPRALVSLKGIPGLDRISFDRRRGLTIGAMARLTDVAASRDIRRKYPAVAYAAAETANVQIRNMGTVAGNLCNAAPSADNAPALLAMGATAELASRDGRREIPLDQFFKGPGSTALQPGELMIAVHVPLPPPRSGTSYQHISARGKVDISAVGVGVMLVRKGKTCAKSRIFLGAVGPVPVRAGKTERLIEGRELTAEMIARAGRKASQEARPISDVRASAEYRRELTAVLTARALFAAHKKSLQQG